MEPPTRVLGIYLLSIFEMKRDIFVDRALRVPPVFPKSHRKKLGIFLDAARGVHADATAGFRRNRLAARLEGGEKEKAGKGARGRLSTGWGASGTAPVPPVSR